MEENSIASYSFYSWLRQGIASEIPDRDNLGLDDSTVTERAEVSVRFKINEHPIPKQVKLIGPGDILGINPQAIIKTEPRNWITDFEANYLPYIEFYEEDFPWRYTPANAENPLEASKLRPWIFLIVLKEDEFSDKQTGGPLPAIEIVAAPGPIFPKTDQTWAWAHVHVQKDMLVADRTATAEEAGASANRLKNLLRLNPDNASSRLLCPRKLERNTAYHAFLIPTFETGRAAGLGRSTSDIDGLKASWSNNGSHEQIFPYYYRWFFRTGIGGDFEFLVDLLEPRAIDERVGVRGMDMQKPNYSVTGLSGPHPVIGLEGALKSPETKSNPATWPPTPPESVEPFLTELQEKVNLQQTSLEAGHPDPIISPPLYGQWHAKVNKLDVTKDGEWVHQLNRDPRSRTASGFGTKVIQKNQEHLMQQAWSQLGDILPTNQTIRQLQLGILATQRLYLKHIEPLPAGKMASIAFSVLNKVKGSPTTLALQIQQSRLPDAALQPAFKRITRPRGAVMKKVGAPEITRKVSVIDKLNSGELTVAPAPPAAENLISVGNLTAPLLPKTLPNWLVQLTNQGYSCWLLAALVLLALAGLFATSNIALYGSALLVSGGLLAVTEWLRPRLQLAATFQLENRSAEQVDSIPARPNFALTEFGQAMPAASSAGNTTDSIESANFRQALKDLYQLYQNEPPEEPERAPLDIQNTGIKIKAAINPITAIPKRAQYLLKIPQFYVDNYHKPVNTLNKVMAHPVFVNPMYRPLRDISSELLIPNLNLIPNNSIALMVVNRPFIEAYMVGLNHEMGRELLWREYPTDQRGSYFRQFWDVSNVVNRDPDISQKDFEESLLDIIPIHEWESESNLGEHENREIPTGEEHKNQGSAEGGEQPEPKLVLVIRGDLLKKYPNTVIYAQKAKWGSEKIGDTVFPVRVLDEQGDSNTTENVKYPIFKAEIEPDLHFLGFDLVRSQVEGNPDPAVDSPGWFFVLQERPGEPRFGLDDKSDETPETINVWNDMAWEHLANFDDLGCIDFEQGLVQDVVVNKLPDSQFTWGRNAADMAYILYQVPVMVAFHASDMLKGLKKTQ